MRWFLNTTVARDNVSISKIVVGERHRKELGDIHGLAKSIGEIGLLQPIGVTSAMQLVWGERRLRACEELGWKDIPAVVDPSLDDTLRAMTAQQHENTCRKPFSHTEAVNVAADIEEIIRQQSKERQHEGQKSGGRGNKKLPAKFTGSNGETREKVAAAVGMSHLNLTKAREVVAKGVPALVRAMDSGKVSVDAAAAIATLDKKKQREVMRKGKAAANKAAKQVKEKTERQREAKRVKEDPCDVVAERWAKAIHAALVPVNSVRGDLGGGKEWARTQTKKNLKAMAKELELVIGMYQQWLSEIREVIDE